MQWQYKLLIRNKGLTNPELKEGELQDDLFFIKIAEWTLSELCSLLSKPNTLVTKTTIKQIKHSYKYASEEESLRRIKRIRKTIKYIFDHHKQRRKEEDKSTHFMIKEAHIDKRIPVRKKVSWHIPNRRAVIHIRLQDWIYEAFLKEMEKVESK